MKKLLLTIIGSSFIALAMIAAPLGDRLLLTAKLTGAQENPVITTNALGVASFLLNSAHDSLCVDITVTGLSGAVVGVHINAGAPGVNGPSVKDLSSLINGNTIKTVIFGPELSAHLKEFLSGQLYVNIITAANPTGEIRGQIQLETDYSFVTFLNGLQLVPPSTTTAYGLGVFNLSKDSSKIKYTVIVQNVTGILTEARLNYGFPGINGALALSLTTGIKGNVISGVINNPTSAFIDSLRNLKVYVDVSTATNPLGKELRGQLINENKYLYFDAYLNGAQEVPPVSTTAAAVASVKINASLDTVWYDIVATGLSGPITASHFHLGLPGVSGNIEVTLNNPIGNLITGKIFSPQLTTAFYDKLLRGDLYLNIHTTANPNGEIRGQVYRLARQGYTMSLDGFQQNPPVVTQAKGTGVISVDRESENAHYMVVTTGLVANAIHFHKQVIGQNGGVVYDLLPHYVNNGAFGYWKATDVATPFSALYANELNADSIYVNVNTAANPNGEIRGQALKKGLCFRDVPTGINGEKTAFANGVVLYPNPSSDLINISFNSPVQSNVSFEIVDVLGKQVITENFTAQAGNNLHSVFVNKLKKGLYFVKIQNEKGQTIERFIKN
jgi:hypothetical protein